MNISWYVHFLYVIIKNIIKKKKMKTLFFNKALRILLVTNALILISAAMFGPISALFVKKSVEIY